MGQILQASRVTSAHISQNHPQGLNHTISLSPLGTLRDHVNFWPSTIVEQEENQNNEEWM
jgi:hypothetical protein